MKKAVVVSHNWNTQETMHTQLEGAGCASDASEMTSEGSWLRRDFPKEDGWTHFCHWTPEAGEDRGRRIAEALLGKKVT